MLAACLALVIGFVVVYFLNPHVLAGSDQYLALLLLAGLDALLGSLRGALESRFEGGRLLVTFLCVGGVALTLVALEPVVKLNLATAAAMALILRMLNSAAGVAHTLGRSRPLAETRRGARGSTYRSPELIADA